MRTDIRLGNIILLVLGNPIKSFHIWMLYHFDWNTWEENICLIRFLHHNQWCRIRRPFIRLTIFDLFKTNKNVDFKECT